MCFKHNQLWLGENNMENNRPDPDKLLEQVKEEESRINQGKLKIFFGYAAGVGKTYYN